ncbi:sulfatase-like hydrolase/transferase [Haladaptatus cibarius]|uniref:sulfatase-like hydrolase/transferase n=1 Tax=Haladaptatus cibarius TaxID=453847 RepID=UPI000679B499|nr:sulfatase-like hydrolase/transferase [Haladaptatus cibarius]
MSANDTPVTVLFTVDSLRADAFTSDSVVAALGERGTVFENAFAHGNWTPFSFPSILGAKQVFTDSRGIGVADAPTLAETLSEAGISTAGFNGANGFLTEHWGYDRGFDEFETFTSGTGDSLYSKYLTAHPTVQAWLQVISSPVRRLLGQKGGAKNVSRMLDVERSAIDFVERAEPPFFLWVHYMDVHTPYVPAPKFVRDETGANVGSLKMLRAHLRAGLGREVGDDTLSDLKSLYRATVRQVDESVGRVLSALDRRGFRDDACVVLAGDHGEEFMEHGHLAHYPKLYEELTHVPLLVRQADDKKESVDTKSVEKAVGLASIPATICDAMGVEHDFSAPSLLDTAVESETDSEIGLDAPSATTPVTSVAVRGEHVTRQPIPRHLDDGELLVSARTADWSYIYHTESENRELYDRRGDPTEQDNLWGEYEGSELASRLHDAVEMRIERIETDGDNESGDVPSEVTNQLKALGYQ